MCIIINDDKVKIMNINISIKPTFMIIRGGSSNVILTSDLPVQEAITADSKEASSDVFT